jgi:hypothetical protein
LDQFVSMRIHDVGPEFVRDLKGMGYNPSADDLVSLRIHGATSEYVKQVRKSRLQPDAGPTCLHAHPRSHARLYPEGAIPWN